MKPVVYVGERRCVALTVIQLLRDRKNSFVLDCGSSCCPHTVVRLTNEDTIDNSRIVECELYYKMRDTLLSLQKNKYDLIIVTPFRGLMTYQDDEEDTLLLQQSWLLLQQLSLKTQVVVGVAEGSQFHKVIRKLKGNTKWVTLSQANEGSRIGYSKNYKSTTRASVLKNNATLLPYCNTLSNTSEA